MYLESAMLQQLNNSTKKVVTVKAKAIVYITIAAALVFKNRPSRMLLNEVKSLGIIIADIKAPNRDTSNIEYIS